MILSHFFTDGLIQNTQSLFPLISSVRSNMNFTNTALQKQTEKPRAVAESSASRDRGQAGGNRADKHCLLLFLEVQACIPVEGTGGCL